ncbi:division/cell wall cluster transcriptional repressor MraZ, partial [Bifidobacterium longum]
MVADQTIRDADANAQGSTTMADLMAGLPPLLLGTYTP